MEREELPALPDPKESPEFRGCPVYRVTKESEGSREHKE
jgi:hypothetical protein